MLIDRFLPVYLFSSFSCPSDPLASLTLVNLQLTKQYISYIHGLSYRINFSLQNRLKNLPQFNNVFFTKCFDDHKIILFSESSYRWTESTFSAGGFKYNRSAKCSPRRRSRRLQRNRKSLRPCSQAGRVTLARGLPWHSHISSYFQGRI